MADERQLQTLHSLEQSKPQLVAWHSRTNHPTYGSLMEVHGGITDVRQRGQDTSTIHLKNPWKGTLQLWMSRDKLEANIVRQEVELSQPNLVPDPVLEADEPESESTEPKIGAQWGKTKFDRWLTKIHVSCGHVPVWPPFSGSWAVDRK